VVLATHLRPKSPALGGEKHAWHRQRDAEIWGGWAGGPLLTRGGTRRKRKKSKDAEDQDQKGKTLKPEQPAGPVGKEHTLERGAMVRETERWCRQERIRLSNARAGKSTECMSGLKLCNKRAVANGKKKWEKFRRKPARTISRARKTVERIALSFVKQQIKGSEPKHGTGGVGSWDGGEKKKTSADQHAQGRRKKKFRFLELIPS